MQFRKNKVPFNVGTLQVFGTRSVRATRYYAMTAVCCINLTIEPLAGYHPKTVTSRG